MATNRDQPLTFFNTSTSSPVAVSESDSYLFDTSQTGSASGSFQNDGFLLAGLDAGEEDFGFSRQRPVVGSIEYYDRHVFLCYKKPHVWPPHIEAAEFDRLPRLLSAALSSRKNDMKKQVCF